MDARHTFRNDQQSALETGRTSSGGVFYASKAAGSRSAAAQIKRETLYLGSLDKIIDRLQELFDQWEQQAVFPPPIDTTMLRQARTAAHEWIAHLIQHAHFGDRVPQIALSVWVEGETLCCLIADNSSGFPLDAYPSDNLDDESTVMSEKGMSWLLIQACTQHLSYRPLGNQGFELEFSIA